MGQKQGDAHALNIASRRHPFFSATADGVERHAGYLILCMTRYYPTEASAGIYSSSRLFFCAQERPSNTAPSATVRRTV